MSLRFTIGLCVIIVGVFGLTLCQPPIPRIASEEMPPFPAVNPETKVILTACSRAERVLLVHDLGGPLSNVSKY